MQESGWSRFVRLVVSGKFEPVESILSISAIVHGLWLFFPGWNIMTFPTTITTTPRLVEMVFAVFMVIAGGLVQASIHIGPFRLSKMRRANNMALFVGWLFAALLSFLATGSVGILWTGYLTIAAIAAVVYLNVSAGVDNGTE